MSGSVAPAVGGSGAEQREFGPSKIQQARDTTGGKDSAAYPGLPTPGAEVQKPALRGAMALSRREAAAGSMTNQPEWRKHGKQAATKAMVAAVMQAGSVAALKQWGRGGIEHAARILGVTPMNPGDAAGCASRGRAPVCRDLLEAARAQGGRRAGLGSP